MSEAAIRAGYELVQTAADFESGRASSGDRSSCDRGPTSSHNRPAQSLHGVGRRASVGRAGERAKPSSRLGRRWPRVTRETVDGPRSSRRAMTVQGLAGAYVDEDLLAINDAQAARTRLRLIGHSGRGHAGAN